MAIYGTIPNGKRGEGMKTNGKPKETDGKNRPADGGLWAGTFLGTRRDYRPVPPSADHYRVNFDWAWRVVGQAKNEQPADTRQRTTTTRPSWGLRSTAT
jgi:hypothetical protein